MPFCAQAAWLKRAVGTNAEDGSTKLIVLSRGTYSARRLRDPSDPMPPKMRTRSSNITTLEPPRSSSVFQTSSLHHCPWYTSRSTEALPTSGNAACERAKLSLSLPGVSITRSGIVSTWSEPAFVILSYLKSTCVIGDDTVAVVCFKSRFISRDPMQSTNCNFTTTGWPTIICLPETGFMERISTRLFGGGALSKYELA